MKEEEKKSKIIMEVDRKKKAEWVRAANQHRLKLIAYIKARVDGTL